jgi:hypothetical protein
MVLFYEYSIEPFDFEIYQAIIVDISPSIVGRVWVLKSRMIRLTLALARMDGAMDFG